MTSIYSETIRPNYIKFGLKMSFGVKIRIRPVMIYSVFSYMYPSNTFYLRNSVWKTVLLLEGESAKKHNWVTLLLKCYLMCVQLVLVI